MFENKEKTVLSIEGMMCKHCVAHVSEALKACKGVKQFDVDLESASAEVIYAPSVVTPEAIAAAVTAAGYPAKVK